jgi:hypothetical protein
MSTYQLTDGVEKLYSIPKGAAKALVTVGDMVKLQFEEEGRFESTWLSVQSVEGDKFTGKIEYGPVWIKSVKFRDIVEFESKHILAIEGGK